eukprot:5595331-Alexandrium_andersonii.AAC.1
MWERGGLVCLMRHVARFEPPTGLRMRARAAKCAILLRGARCRWRGVILLFVLVCSSCSFSSIALLAVFSAWRRGSDRPLRVAMAMTFVALPSFLVVRVFFRRIRATGVLALGLPGIIQVVVFVSLLVALRFRAHGTHPGASVSSFSLVACCGAVFGRCRALGLPAHRAGPSRPAAALSWLARRSALLGVALAALRLGACARRALADAAFGPPCALTVS